jgi:hypothetical protein
VGKAKRAHRFSSQYVELPRSSNFLVGTALRAFAPAIKLARPSWRGVRQSRRSRRKPAHSYLLGPTGESNGCVSFEDYPKFLQAFLRGEVDRMVVVPDLKFETLRMARARGREADRYALND